MAAWVALWRSAQNVEKPTTRDDNGGNARLEGGDRNKGELDSENRHDADAATIVPGQAPSDDDVHGSALKCQDAQQQLLLLDSAADPGPRRCDGYADSANHRLEDYDTHDDARRDDNVSRSGNTASGELDGDDSGGAWTTTAALGTATRDDYAGKETTKHDDNARCEDNRRNRDNAASDDLDGKAATTTVTTPALGTAVRGDNEGVKPTTYGGENTGRSADEN